MELLDLTFREEEVEEEEYDIDNKISILEESYTSLEIYNIIYIL